MASDPERIAAVSHVNSMLPVLFPELDIAEEIGVDEAPFFRPQGGRTVNTICSGTCRKLIKESQARLVAYKRRETTERRYLCNECFETMPTWRKLIEAERKDQNDGPILACTLTDEELDRMFDNKAGPSNTPFTAWSANRTYFPAIYDGGEWVESVPRNPSNEATYSVGGY